jgi:hypothetical protein
LDNALVVVEFAMTKFRSFGECRTPFESFVLRAKYRTKNAHLSRREVILKSYVSSERLCFGPNILGWPSTVNTRCSEEFEVLHSFGPNFEGCATSAYSGAPPEIPTRIGRVKP